MKKHKIILFLLIISVFVSLFQLCGCQKSDGLSIVVISDTHFAGKETHSYEGEYLEVNDTNGSGKQMRYLDDIVDAFIDQMLEEKPDYILITGDLTFIGAKASHTEFSEKLSVLSEAGIKVLVIPGNHDIVSYAYIFPDGEPVETEPTTPEDFAEIYADFGYTGAISYDSDSLSYVYDTGKGAWIFMLDTNLSYGALYGKLSETTLSWLEEQLKACQEAGAVPIAAGHHNLFVHNEAFTLGYVIGNAADVKKLFNEYETELYFSGHIHTQHIASEDGITDIVNEAFSVYPHRYGCIILDDSGWKYESKTTDVSGYAKEIGASDENLLNYDEYGYSFFYDNAYNQAKERLSELVTDDKQLDAFCALSASTNVNYFGGTLSKVDVSVLDEFYEAAAGTHWGEYINNILQDRRDFIVWPQEDK